jgi:hypothetical protein
MIKWKEKLEDSNLDLTEALSRHLLAGNPPDKIASIEPGTNTIEVWIVAVTPACLIIF